MPQKSAAIAGPPVMLQEHVVQVTTLGVEFFQFESLAEVARNGFHKIGRALVVYGNVDDSGVAVEGCQSAGFIVLFLFILGVTGYESQAGLNRPLQARFLNRCLQPSAFL
jgi:hypothetical protein